MTRRIAVVGSIASLILVIGTAACGASSRDEAVPAFESLTHQPDASISGTIVYVSLEGEDADSCINVVAASGVGQPVSKCDEELARDLLGFTRDGGLLAGHDTENSGLVAYRVLDPITFAERETFAAQRPDWLPRSLELGAEHERRLHASGDLVVPEIFGGEKRVGSHEVWVARDDEGKNRLYTSEGSGSFDLTWAFASPDRKWFTVQTTTGALLVGDNEGNVRELASKTIRPTGTSALMASIGWFQPGFADGTVDVEALKLTYRTPITSTSLAP